MTNRTAHGAGAAPSALAGANLPQILGAALIGLFIVLGVGFAPMAAVHNASHDVRHSFSFPCH